jgi:hypothetical protein
MVNHVKMNTDGLWGDWEVFTWKSADIVGEEEVSKARATMDPRLFAQEYLGEFILSSGRAFPDFDESIHAAKPVLYDPSLHLCLSWDFNIDNTCLGVIQHYKGEVRVIEEITSESWTSPACATFLDRAKERKWDLNGLCVYGDPSGNARDSTSGLSDWTLIRNAFRTIKDIGFRVPLDHWGLKDTVNSVNAKILAADGTVNLRIDPKCKTIINDLRSALWPDKDELRDWHCLAWLRYFIEYEFPIQSNAGDPSYSEIGTELTPQ